MRLLPELEPLLTRIRAVGAPERAAPRAERRALAHAGIEAQQRRLVEPVRPVAQTDHRIAVGGGEVALRLYRPPLEGPLGCHLFVHGGGWWMGTLDLSDLACARIAREVGCAVASVDHRWAPEHRYPTQVEDCFAAFEWLAARAGELGLDRDLISIGGVFSGANLAAATALVARDRGGPAPIAQVLEVPVLDLTMAGPSIDALDDGCMLTRERLELEIADYCEPARRMERYASPLLAVDLAGLPPTLIATAEYDLLRDDGERYAERLSAAGVAAGAVRWRGHLHGSLAFTGLLASARDWQRRSHDFLRERHRRATLCDCPPVAAGARGESARPQDRSHEP